MLSCKNNYYHANRSESPSQALLISLAEAGGTQHKMYLAYDNMCNLARLNIAQKPLPFPPPMDRLWANIGKIIDVFHFKNHVSEECKRNFSPSTLKSAYPVY